MKPAPFELVRAESAEHAASALAEHGDDAKILAGGQSLLPMMGMRLAAPAALIDISRVAELRGDLAASNGSTVIGAVTTHSDIEDGRVSDPTGGWLRHVASGLGYRAIRNRGTVAGSLAHADGSAEWPVVMTALGAVVQVLSVDARREIACTDLFEGFFSTSLEDNELITGVRIPHPAPGTSYGFVKSTRKVGEFAESMCFVVDGADGATVCLGGHRGIPRLLPEVAQLLAAGLDRESLEDRARVVASVVDTLSAEDGGGHPDPEVEYRWHLHGTTVWRAISSLAPTPGATDRSAS